MVDEGLRTVLAEIDPEQARVVVHCQYQDKDLIRQVPGRRWDGTLRQWSTSISWAACQALRGVFGNRLVVGPLLREWSINEHLTRVAPSLSLRELTDGEGDQRLFPHQRADVLWLKVATDGLLGIDMGTGKTASIVVALNEVRESALPALVVCPKSVMESWRREFQTWAPDLTVSVVSGPASKRQKALEIDADAYIISWDNVRRHSRLAPFGSYALRHCQVCDPEDKGKQTLCERCPKELNQKGFKTVVVDEGHLMKDPSSKRSRAVWAVQHGPTVTRRWTLTGTPIGNHPGDLWSVMHGVSSSDFSGRTDWNQRYALLSWNTFGGLDIVGVNPQTKDEFFRILDPRFRRMPKALVLPHLPPKLYQERLLDMPGEQKKAYQQMAEHLIAELREGRLIATNPLAQLTRLMQFASATCALTDDGGVIMVEPSCKLDELETDVEALGDQPFVVSAESRLLIELASARLNKLHVPHTLIVGGQSIEQRQQAIDDFQSGRVRACLFTLKAGGVGVTLTRAGTLIRLQRSYSALDNQQGEDRVHRIGSEQHESIFIIDYVAEGTVEEVSQKLALHEKAEMAEEVIRDRQTLARLLKGVL